jgi:hypothetical protein
MPRPTIVKIQGKGSDDSRFGSGWVVGPQTVLTCAHVLDPEWEHRASHERSTRVCSTVDIDVARKACRAIPLAVHRSVDLALVRCPRIRSLVRPLFLTGLGLNAVPWLNQLRPSATGFSTHTKGLVTLSGLELLAVTSDDETADDLAFQVMGGAWEGMSGSPLLIQFGDRTLCVGLVFHGGASAATSRVLASTTIVRFLKAHGVHADHVSPLDLLQLTPRPIRTAGRATDDASRDVWTVLSARASEKIRLHRGRIERSSSPNATLAVPLASIAHLLEAEGLAACDVGALSALWRQRLALRGLRREELLNGARAMVPALAGQSPTDAALAMWRTEVRNRLHAQGGTQPPAVAPALALLFERWPKMLLEDRWWTTFEPPLTGLPPFPIDEVWVAPSVVPIGRRERLFSGNAVDVSMDSDSRMSSWLARSFEFVLNDSERAVAVVGEPGGGKTTMMKMLARCAITSPGRFILPVYVPLRDYARWVRREPELTPIQYFFRTHGVGEPEAIRQCLRHVLEPLASSILVILDGWDEVTSPAIRQRIAAHVGLLSQKFKTLVASRPSGFPRQLPITSLYRLDQFNPQDMHTLIEKWFSAAGSPSLTSRVLAYLPTPGMAAFASNPFVLSLICATVFQRFQASRRREHLPRNRAELYAAAVEGIYSQFRVAYPGRPAIEKFRRQIERVALWLFDDAEDAPRYVFSAQEFDRVARKSGLFTKIIRPSRLVTATTPDALREPDTSFQFLHATLQEYLASSALLSADTGPAHAFDLEGNRLLNRTQLGLMRFAAGRGGPSAHAFWSAVRALILEPDRFGILYCRLASLVAETGRGGVDGGKILLGVDLRNAIWEIIDNLGDAAVIRDVHEAALMELDLRDFIRQALKRAAADNDFASGLPKVLQPYPDHRGLRELILEAANDRHAAIGAAGRRVALEIAAQFDMPEVNKLKRRVQNIRLPMHEREDLLYQLSGTGDPDAIEILEPLARLRGPLQSAALAAIADLGGTPAAQALIRLYHVAKAQGRRDELVMMIGGMSGDHGWSFLVDELARCGGKPTRDAAQFLDALSNTSVWRGENVIAQYLDWRRHRSVKVRTRAARILGAATGAGLDILRRTAFEDPSSLVRTTAIESLDVTRLQAADCRRLLRIAGARPVPAKERVASFAAAIGVCGRLDREGGTDARYLVGRAARLARNSWKRPGHPLAYTAASMAFHLGPTLVSELIDLLSRTSAREPVRAAACRSLGILKEKRAIAPLMQIISPEPTQAVFGMLESPSDRDNLVFDAVQAVLDIEPAQLLVRSTPIVTQMLARFSANTGHLVFRDYIRSADGQTIARSQSAS